MTLPDSDPATGETVTQPNHNPNTAPPAASRRKSETSTKKSRAGLLLGSRPQEQDMDAQQADAAKHTPGPWRWMETELNSRIAKQVGRSRSQLRKKDGVLLFSLKGPPNGNPDHLDVWRDRWDYRTVMELSWDCIKGDEAVNVSPSDADKALIAAAPDHYTNARELVRMSDEGYSLRDADGAQHPEWEYLLENARAAIAKAEKGGAA